MLRLVRTKAGTRPAHPSWTPNAVRSRHLRIRTALGVLGTCAVWATPCVVLALPGGAQTAADAQRLAERMDAAISAGSLQEYDSLFEPLHAHVHARRGAWLAGALRSTRWDCISKLRDFGVVDGHGVAMLEISMTPKQVADEQAAKAQDGAVKKMQTMRSTHYVAFDMRDGEPVGLVNLEVDASHLPKHPLSQYAGGKFGCRACNYSIRSAENWLVAPHAPSRVGCLEAVSFYALDDAVALDVTIHVSHGNQVQAAQVVSTLVQHNTAPGLHAAEIVEWTPPHYAQKAVDGLYGAQADLVDPESQKARISLRVAVFGPVIYVFTAYGVDTDPRRARVEELLAGFMLRETDLQRVRTIASPITLHTGGKLVDGRYSNERLGVEFEGPEGATPQLHCGANLLHVSFSCAETATRLDVRAVPPPLGLPTWTQRAADLSLEQAMRSRNLELAEDSGWIVQSNGAHQRDVTATVIDAAGPKQVHVFRAILPEDTSRLFVLDARGLDTQSEVLRSLFDGLKF